MIINSEQALQRLTSKENIITIITPINNSPLPPAGESGDSLLTPSSSIESPDFKLSHWQGYNNGGPTGLSNDRGNGCEEIPLETKVAIATLAQTMPRREVADMFDVCERTVSNYKAGEINRGKKDAALSSALEKSLDRIQDLAIERMVASIGFMTDDKMENSKAIELSAIAANMSKVIERTLPKEKQGPTIQVHVYAPRPSAERHFETIEV